jgi:hypothetical protein
VIDDVLDELGAGFDAAFSVDPATLDPDALAAWTVGVHVLAKRASALATLSTATFDRHGDTEGAIGTAAWVAWKCKVSTPEAKAELSRGRALRHMPATTDAYVAGAIGFEQVRLLAAAWRAAPQAFAAEEASLVADAIDQRYDQFRRRVEYFKLEHDRSGSDDRAAEAMDRRELHASRTFEDTVAINALLDPIGGAVYLNELERIEKGLFEADWAEARARLGDAATAQDLLRSPAQRRADAQVIMAVRSATLTRHPRHARPLLAVHVGWETFHGMLSQLDDGTVVNPTTLLPWLTDAEVERVVFGGPSRVIDIGEKQRLFRGGTRRAVECRDLTCWHDSCDTSYRRADVDHITRYEHDGPTTQANGRVACPHHNPGRRRPRQPQPPDDD